MRSMLSSVVLFFCFILVFAGCQREVEGTLPSPPPSDPLPPVTNITTTITGRIVSENKMPVAGAAVSAGAQRTITDVNGHFKLSRVLVNKNTGFIKVEKEGFFTGSRTFVTHSQNGTYVEIELIPKNEGSTVDGEMGGSLSVTNGGSITFQPNSFVNINTKQAYTGTVVVSAFYLNPVAARFSFQMPGDLRGLTAKNEEKGLQAFGMLAVELKGTGGEKLQLAPGKQATVRLPIDAALQKLAPGSLPLWFYDEAKGLWIEEGRALKQGSEYLGTVTHFSFWGTSAPYDLINFRVTIKDKNDNTLPGLRVEVQLSTDSSVITGSAFTDSLGVAAGNIPKDKKLKLIVYNQRHARVYAQEIGPFTSATDLGNVVIDNTGLGMIIVSGPIYGCSPGAASGTVKILANGKTYTSAISANGVFFDSIPMVLGGPTFIQVYAIDDSLKAMTDTIHVLVTDYKPKSLFSRACRTASFQHFSFTTETEMVTETDTSAFAATRTGRNTAVHYIFKRRSPNMIIDFDFDSDETTGSFAVKNLQIDYGTRVYRKDGNITVHITEWDKENKYIKGHLSAIAKDPQLQFTKTLINSFRIQYK